MPTVSFGGINTGLPPDLVEKLVEAERIPLKQMEVTKGKSENRLKLVKELETKVTEIRKSISELASTKGFSDIKLTSGDPNIVTGVVDPNAAVPGNWNVEVIKLANKASVLTNGFPDKDRTQIGVGYFKFETPDGNKEVYITKEKSTLQGVADSINAAGVGVRASVINDKRDPDAPYRLILSADGTGSDNDVKYPTLYFLDGDQDIFFEENRPADNGVVKVDGFEFEIGDNTLKDMVPGVTLDIKQAAPGKTVSLSVKEDYEVVSGKIKTFVDAMNGVLAFIQQQNQMNEKTDTTQTLGGDGLLRSIEMRLRNLVQSPQFGIGGPIRQLNQLGIAFNRNGTLEFDQKKFNTILANNPKAVSGFLAGDGFATGFVPALRREIAGLLDNSFGPLTNRKKGLEQKISQIDQRIETKERQLAKKEDQLRAKFSKLEETMSRIKGQGVALAGLGGGGGGAGGGQPKIG